MKELLESLSNEDREEWAKIGEFLENDRQMGRQMQQQKVNEMNVR